MESSVALKKIMLLFLIFIFVSPGCDCQERKISHQEKPIENPKSSAPSPQNLSDSDNPIPPGFQVSSVPEAVNKLADKVCKRTGTSGPTLTCYLRETKPWLSKTIVQVADKDLKPLKQSPRFRSPRKKLSSFPTIPVVWFLPDANPTTAPIIKCSFSLNP
jgi:hypothetical protein